jgi:hypothetical protein
MKEEREVEEKALGHGSYLRAGNLAVMISTKLYHGYVGAKFDMEDEL